MPAGGGRGIPEISRPFATELIGIGRYKYKYIRISLDGNEMLLVHGNSGTLAMVKVRSRRQFLVETPGLRSL